MKKLNLILLFFCFFVQQGFAQFDGLWEGTVVNSFGFETGKFDLFVETKKGNLIGYTWTDWGDCAARTSIVGTYNKNTLSFKEVEILEERGESCDWCFFDAILTVQCDGKDCYLVGTYKSYDPLDGHSCGSGKIILRRKIERA